MRKSRLPVVLTAVLAAVPVPVFAVPAPAGFARAAGAATPLGPLSIAPTSGSVSANPLFTSVSTGLSCPAGYGSDVGLRVAPSGGDGGGLLVAPQHAGGYDTAPVRFPATVRTLAQALGVGAVADGDYDVYAECFGETAGRHPNRFQTTITVTGGSWRIRTDPPGDPDPATSRPAATVAPGPTTAAATPVTPTDPGGTATPTAAADAAPAPSGTPVAAAGTADPAAGRANWLVGALAGFLVLVVAALLVRRRRPNARTTDR